VDAVNALPQKPPSWLTRVWRRLTGYVPPPEKPVPVKMVEVRPVPPAALLRAVYGNIQSIAAEADDPKPNAEQHVFPDREEPKTRFEAFNQRLFLITPSATVYWPVSRVSDFATELSGPISAILAQAHLKLRPYHPIIYDPAGMWAQTSMRLETDPEYQNPVVEAYLAIPLERRPVVLSQKIDRQLEPKDTLSFYRYGFEPFTLSLETMVPYIGDCLTELMSAVADSRERWLWFSVARMRQAVAVQNKAMDAVRAFLEQEAEAEQADEHRNRFAVLWNIRTMGAETPSLPAGDDTTKATEEETA
jgi:hypothetical protein